MSITNDDTKEVLALNDKLRAQLPYLPSPHRVILTKMAAALEREALANLFKKIRDFKDFTIGDDPYGEHDFISIEVENFTWLMKIDYYDESLEYLDRSSNGVRVFTIMNSSEY